MFRYLLFNKPFNVLCQFTHGTTPGTADSSRRTLADFIHIPGVYPAGRLDFDSEGLLVLTSDGAFQRRLTDPKFSHPRTYWVQVEGIVTDSALRNLKDGITIQDYRTRPAKARAISQPDLPPREPPIRERKSIPTSWLEITLTEGRNRQVRRMTAAVGLPTLRLVRAAIGNLTLTGLARGDHRDITAAELRSIYQYS